MDLGKQWHFNRPKLVAGLADQLMAHQRIAMFGDRQTGKTTLMRSELIPELARRGVLPVYIECWADKKDPLGSINHALTKALEQIELTPDNGAKRLAKTPIKKVSILGVGVDLGELGKRTLPDSPTLRFDALLTMLLEASKKDLVLLFDEFQTVASADDADAISAGIRAALTQASERVGVIFSGSSQTELLLMFQTSRAPLFQFARETPYQVLREDFIAHIVAKFKLATGGRDLNNAMALDLLERCGHQPAPFLQVIGLMVLNPALTLDSAMAAVLSPDARSIWTTAWEALTAFQRGVLQLVTAGEGPTTQASREWLQKLADEAGPGEMPAKPKGKRAAASAAASTGTVDRAVKALESKGLIAKTTKGWEVVDPLMRLWLQQNAPIAR